MIQSKPIDIARLLDRGPWSTYQKLLTALASLAIVFDGFDIQILGFAIPSLINEWHVTRAAFAPVLALGLVGMVAGGPLCGYCGDRFGRRATLLGTILLFGLSTCATAFTNSLAALAVFRFFTGLGAGGAVPNASTLVAEFAPVRLRPAAVKLTLVCVSLGGLLAGLIATWVLPAFGWRVFYLVGGTAPLLCALLLFVLLPESPRFLAQHPSGWPALARFLTRAGHHVPPQGPFEDSTERSTAQRARASVLLNREHRRDTIGLWTAFFFSLGAIFLIFGWLPALLSSQGLDLAAASKGLAAYNSGGVAGVLLWAVLTTLLGSRGPILFGALATAAAGLAVLLVPVHPPNVTPLLLATLALHGLLANAVQTSMYAVAAHIYPTAVRATGVAFASTLGRTGAVFSSLFGSIFIAAGPQAYWGTIAAAMIGSFLGLAFIRRHFTPQG